MYPSLEDVKALAASGDYRRIPVSRELYADRFTPIEVMRTLRAASKHCYLLESAESHETWGRYSFLGYAPTLELTCSSGTLRIRYDPESECQREEASQVDHPGDAIRKVLADYRSPKVEGLPPFTGGLVGYFSYDYIQYAEPSLKKPTADEDFRDVDLMLFDKVIVFDNYRQKLILIAGVSTEDIEGSYESAEKELDAMASLLLSGARAADKPLHLRSPLELCFSKERYMGMVEKARHYIKEGDIFQVVLSNPMEAQAEGSLFDVYRVLRTSNPSPYMFYFSSDDIEVSGASPETLVKLQDGVLHTFPLAGTRPRGATEQEDQRLERELLADEKEKAEHNMLVDLGRNDLGKISSLGTVQVEKYMSIERYSHVMHIGSTVRGTIAPDKDAVDAVDAILPAGTLSGAPKLRACEIIDELEDRKRGIYGGAIGYLDFTGNLDVCISIRLAYKKNGKICVQSGAGIVYDSVPETEYLECRNKARAVVAAIEAAEGGIL
jgi:anthranilate synthase component 1